MRLILFVLKHAILVTAYKNPEHLIRMANALDDRFTFYIHIDRKSTITAAETAELKKHPRIRYVTRTYNVNWAGVNHLKAILELLHAASASDADYFHTISGQDFPIMTADEFDSFFSAHPATQFIEHFAMPAGHWTNGGMHRIWYFYFFDWFNNKKKFGNLMNRAVRRLQMILGVKRQWPKSLLPLHGGGTWWSITRSCALHVAQYDRSNPQLLKRLRYTLCPEEMYFQTVIMNSEYASQAVSNHMRYIDWAERNGNSPANLDESDFEKVVNSGKLFARKIDYPVSEGLIQALMDRRK